MSRPLFIALFWLGMALMLCALPLLQGRGLQVAGDDAMRMVEVEDLVDGQAWTDTTQYRDNTPYGGPMHWSRLVDAPLAGLVILARPLLGIAGARDFAATVWPLLVLLGLVALLTLLTDRLAGPGARLALAGVAALALPVRADFLPGSVDHHNVQDVLALGLILATIGARTSRGGAVAAGLLAATILAIGAEGLAVAFAALCIVPVYWVIAPAAATRRVASFAVTFALAILGHWLAVTSPAGWFAARCDALSASYVAGAGLYAVAVLVALGTGRSLPAAWQRLLLLAVCGAVAGAIALWLFPHCLGGPYGDVDPALAPALLGSIGEAQPLWVWATVLDPTLALPVLPLAGLVATALATRLDRERRAEWAVLLVFVLAEVLVMVLQVRAAKLASCLVMPAAAWAITRAWEHFRLRQSLGSALAAVGTCLAFMGAVHYVVASLMLQPPAAIGEGRTSYVASVADCDAAASYKHLAALPPSRVLSYVFIGPQILSRTPHSVVTAGYHRNEQGMRDQLRFFSGSEAEAKAVVAERGLDYLVFCNGIDPADGLAGVGSFAGLGWDWLERVSAPDEPVQIYAFRHG